jgi:hypothetical protein
MTEQNISDKLSETLLTSIFKKTYFFEKLENIQGLIAISTGFFIITTTITLSISLLNFYLIKNINIKNDEQIKLLKNNNNLYKIEDVNNLINFRIYEEYKKKVDEIINSNIENQRITKMLLEKIDNINIASLSSIGSMTSMTSMSDFEKYCKNLVSDNIDEEDNELLCESYDNLPCNNVIKTTSSGFFYWK